jgi:hypothetical protein
MQMSPARQLPGSTKGSTLNEAMFTPVQGLSVAGTIPAPEAAYTETTSGGQSSTVPTVR